MRHLKAFLSLSLLAFASCAEPGPIHVVPVDDPPVGPGPINPGPVKPPPAGGVVTIAAFDKVTVGTPQADVVLQLGAPFRESDEAGFHIFVYALANSDSIGWIFFQNGLVVRKSRL